MQQDEMMEYYEQEQPLNIKAFIFRLLSKWYWFALCGFLGLALAWINNRYMISTWQVESTVLVSDGSKSTGVDNLFESLSLTKSVNMDNQIGLLKSYNLNRQAIGNLNWRTSCQEGPNDSDATTCGGLQRCWWWCSSACGNS